MPAAGERSKRRFPSSCWTAGESEITLNLETTRGYLTALREAAAELDLMDDLRLSDLISFPDIFTVHKTEIDPDEMWAMVEPVAREAVDAFVKMRETEGAQLKIDLQNRLRNHCRFPPGD